MPTTDTTISPPVALDDGWIQFMDGGGNQPPHFADGNYYRGKLIKAEDVETHIGGPTGHYAKLTFDVAGIHLHFTATLPSQYINLPDCTKLLKALAALGWDRKQTIPSLIGRTCWGRIGKNRRGYEVIDDLRAEVTVELNAEAPK